MRAEIRIHGDKKFDSRLGELMVEVMSEAIGEAMDEAVCSNDTDRFSFFAKGACGGPCR